LLRYTVLTMDIEALAQQVKSRRVTMEHAKAEYHLGLASYDEMARAAQDFCAAFSAYHLAKFGKPKRLDFRAVLR
jgi:hypothetical protein